MNSIKKYILLLIVISIISILYNLIYFNDDIYKIKEMTVISVINKKINEHNNLTISCSNTYIIKNKLNYEFNNCFPNSKITNIYDMLIINKNGLLSFNWDNTYTYESKLKNIIISNLNKNNYYNISQKTSFEYPQQFYKYNNITQEFIKTIQIKLYEDLLNYTNTFNNYIVGRNINENCCLFNSKNNLYYYPYINKYNVNIYYYIRNQIINNYNSIYNLSNFPNYDKIIAFKFIGNYFHNFDCITSLIPVIKPIVIL
jgi:hypothetical protein